MTISFVLVLVGFALLIAGAELLVRGSVTLSLRLGMKPLIAGLTIVAFGTSAPELAVSIRASLGGSDGIALGNVVGSNICNIALILGCAGLIRPLRVDKQIIRSEVPVMIACTVLLLVFLYDGTLSRSEGLLLVIGVAAYTWNTIRVAQQSGSAPQDVQASSAPAVRLILFIVAGTGMLALGGSVLVRGATDLARSFGVSDAVIGLTLVAVGTSLPELVTSCLASFRGDGDLAIGNVVGSNIFNILCILGVAAVIRPIEAVGMSNVDLVVMAVLAILCLPLMRSGFELNRAEAAFLLVIYVGYVAWCANGQRDSVLSFEPQHRESVVAQVSMNRGTRHIRYRVLSKGSSPMARPELQIQGI